ncbi:MAG: LPD23 domain-containing protein [Kiritimatiellia bacterium]
MVAQAFYNPDVDYFEGWEQDAAVGGISGAIAQAGVFYLQSLGRGGRVARRAYDESQTITGTAAIIDDLQELVQTSKLQERDPVMAKRLLDMIGEDVNRPIYLSAEAAQVFYQDGVDPTALLETDPELAAELNRARITGEDVEIPVHRLVGVLAAGQGQYDLIKPFIKERPDGMDLATAQKIQSDPEAINQWLRDAMDAEREQMAGMERDAAALTKSETVERTIYQGILNSELPRISSPVTARQYAGLMRRMYETVSERLDGNEDMIRRLDERMARLSVRGPARTLNIKPDQLDLTLEKMRDIRRGKQKRRKIADYPMRNFLTKRGGVSSASPEGQEIRFMGVQAPRLLRKKGAPIDNIPVADLAAELGIDAAKIPADATGLYADRQFIYDALRAEAGGEPLVRSEQDQAALDEDAALEDLDRVLSELGLDVDKDSNAKIKVALEAERKRLGAQAEGGVFYQFAGPQSMTADIHALASAKDRIAAGESRETVRKETGWFQGVDGKWRYEISDDEAKFNTSLVVKPDDIKAQISEQVAITQEGDLVKAAWGEGKDYVGAFGKDEQEARENLYRTIAKKRTPTNAFNPEKIEDGKDFYLGDIISHEKLFAAYPDLKWIPVSFNSNIDASGQVNIYGSEMVLNPDRFKTPDDMLSTILHEIQHLIQRREGFARGGNLEISKGVKQALASLVIAKQRDVSEFESQNQKLFAESENARRMLGYAQLYQDFNRLIDYSRMDKPSGVFRHIRNATQWFYSPIIQENKALRDRASELSRAMYLLPRRGPKRNAFLRDFSFELAQLLRDAVPTASWEVLKNDPRKTTSMLRALEREAQKASKKLKPHYELIKGMRVATDQYEANQYRSPFEVYQLLAGEVEARNTQSRATMTDEERRATPPESTMTRDDFGEKKRIFNEDVIVVMQGGEIETPFIANIESTDYRGQHTAPESDRVLFQDTNPAAEGLRSALLDSATNLKQAKGSGDQMLGILKNTAGVKAEEIAWTGLDEFLAGKASVTKDEVIQYLEQNQVQVEDVVLGDQSASKRITKDTAAQRIENGQKVLWFRFDDETAVQIDSLDSLGADSFYAQQVDAGLAEWRNGGTNIEGRPAGDTKFQKYTLPGGENYREVLLTLPGWKGRNDQYNKRIQEIAEKHGRGDRPQGYYSYATPEEIAELDALQQAVGEPSDDFKSGHFDAPNILAHVRLNDRVDADGKRVLFVEEIQSDWHQKGRKKGYQLGTAKAEDIDLLYVPPVVPEGHNPANYPGYWESRDKRTGVLITRHGGRMTEEQARDEAIKFSVIEQQDRVPDAPFKKTWHEMAFRRVAQMAAQQGYDRIAWTPGDVQNERFDLSAQIQSFQYEAIFDDAGNKTGLYEIAAYDLNGDKIVDEEEVTLDRIEELAGKDIAQKVQDEQGRSMAEERPLRPNWMSIEGDGLKLGGDGMKGFYDKIVPTYAKKFGKKFGASVGTAKIAAQAGPIDSDAAVQPREGETISDAMRRMKEESGLKQIEVHSMDITDSMREAARRGFELFQDQPTGPRGYISFAANGDIVINLLEQANLSTFLHEAGHFWLSTMRDLYRDPGATDQMKADWAGTKDWMRRNSGDIFRDLKANNPYKAQESSQPGRFDVRLMGRVVETLDTMAKAEARATALHAGIVAEINAGGGQAWVESFIDRDAAPTTDAENAAFIALDEYFARGFEAYLMEGKAPSETVEGMFDTFRSWLVKIYNYAKAVLRVNVSPEMAAIFDRLVATDAEIEAHVAEKPDLFTPNPNTLEMLTKAQAEAYIRQNDKQIKAAKDKAFRKAMREHERKATQWYKEERAKVVAELEDMAKTRPLYRALQLITKGEDFDGNKIEGPRKLDRAAVIAAFGQEVIRFLPKGTTVEKGGINPTIIANLAGYKNATAMIQEMMGAETMAQHIRREADAIMIERHGDMLNDGTIERQALEYLMAEEAKAQLMELKALSAQTGVAYPEDGDFQKAAWQLLREQKVDESIKPNRYLQAALRHARAYGKAVGQKDYDKAADAKRREILNRYLYKYSVESRANVDKANKHFAELAKRPKRKQRPAIDVAYHDKIRELLATVSLAPRPTAARALRLEMAAIARWMTERETDDNAALMTPPELETAEGVTHYRDMTLGEYMAFRDLIANIEKQGRMKMELIVEGEKKNLQEQAETGAQYIRANNKERKMPIDSQRAESRTWIDSAKAMGVSIINLSRKMETLVDLMAGGNQEARDYLWKRIREPIFKAEIKERKMQIEAARALTEIQFKHFGKAKVKIGDKTHWVTAEDLSSKNAEIFINQKIGMMAREEIIMVAHYWGNADGRDRLLNDPRREWDEADIAAILKQMRKRDWDYIQAVWDFYNSYWPQVEAIERRRYGYAPDKVEALPFTVTTADGVQMDIAGGYAPLKYDGQMNARTAENDASAIAKQLMTGKVASVHTKRGHTHERKDGVRMSVKLNFSVINSHVAETIHDLALGEAIVGVAKFVRHKAMSDAIIETMGMDALREIEVWLADIAAGGIRASSQAERMVAGLRHTMTMGALGLRVSTVALQVTGVANTIAEVGAVNFMRGLSKYAAMGGPLSAGKEVAKKSEFMRQRPETFNVNVAESITRLKNKGGFLEAGQSAMLIPMMKIQYQVDTITWLAAFDGAMAEGKSEADAITEADSAVERAQSGGALSSLSAIERGTVGQNTRLNEFIKSMTWMMSYFNTKFNIAYRKTRRVVKDPNPMAVAGLLGDYLVLFWLEFLLGEMILGKVPDFEDEEEPELAMMKWGLEGGIGTAVAGVAFLRDGWGAYQGFSSGPAYSKGIDQVATSMGKMMTMGVKLAEGEEVNPYDALRTGLTLGNFMSPIKMPTSQMNQIIRGIEQQSEGEETSPMDYIRYKP